MPNGEPTIQDVLDAVNETSTIMEERFSSIEDDIAGMKTDIAGMKTDIAGMKTDIAGMKTDIADIKRDMVTKTYFADKHADLIMMLRQADTKLKATVEILREKKVISPADQKRILALEPFAQAG